MKTDDDEQSKTRQEDVHEDPGEEKQKQQNQDLSSQTGEKKAGTQVNARLSVQAVFFLGDGHRLVEDCILEHVPLDKQKSRSGNQEGKRPNHESPFHRWFETIFHSFAFRGVPHTRALTALSL